MAFDQSFPDPIITLKRDGKNFPYLEIKELVSVINGQALLTEIPYKKNRVQIIEQVVSGNGTVTDTVDGGTFSNTSPTSTSTSATFSEIENGIPSDTQYIVDYVQGVMTFNPSQEGSKFEISYTGTGTHFFPASRVYTQNNGNGTIDTLDTVVATGNEKITEISNSINNANQATLNATNATSNYQTLLNQQLLIYKPSVATFSAIATTYPTPSLGWTTVAKDTGIRYRYDGSTWVDIGNSMDSDGFRISVSQNPPSNTNLLWVDIPSGNTTAKVVQSDTAPTDTSVIWWQP
ncbi:MAG: hypothetical protein Q8880_13545 [Bacteroidota bacterium]|nr:hypothetical protein [Bacteroidota bacterium]